MNLRVLTKGKRERRTGGYNLKGKVSSRKPLTKVKILELKDLIQKAVAQLNLIGLITIDMKVTEHVPPKS